MAPGWCNTRSGQTENGSSAILCYLGKVPRSLPSRHGDGVPYCTSSFLFDVTGLLPRSGANGPPVGYNGKPPVASTWMHWCFGIQTDIGYGSWYLALAQNSGSSAPMTKQPPQQWAHEKSVLVLRCSHTFTHLRTPQARRAGQFSTQNCNSASSQFFRPGNLQARLVAEIRGSSVCYF